MCMKNIFYSLAFMLIIFFGTSCKDASFLDETVTSDLDLPKIFADSAYTVGYLSEMYVQLGFDVSHKRFSVDLETYGGLQGACDEVELKVKPKVTTDIQFATGTVNPVSVSDDAWKKCYENIRKVNIFFQGIDYAPLQAGLKRTYRAEARFLRAWYYATLLKHYGGVPIIGDTIYTVHDHISMKRNTYEECVDYIISESRIAMEDLTTITFGRDFGRATKGACMGLIARVLLYAASPLFNGGIFGTENNYPKELVGYKEYKEDRWRLAAEAAADLIKLNAYRLYKNEDNDYGGKSAGFAKLFFGDNSTSHSGHILDWRRGQSRERENLFQPPSFGSNGMGGFPYQGLVDAFLMKNGKRIDEEGSGYDDNNPYANRDPRFYHSIYYDQTVLIDRETARPTDVYVNADGTASSQDAVHYGTPTGYYNGKQLNKRLAGNYIHTGEQSIPLMRYAELLLNYAEAQNEYQGPDKGFQYIGEDGNESTFTPYTAIRLIRERADIDEDGGKYGLKDGLSQKEMREVIRHERRIELALEAHRFWDVRRWMIAETTENKMMTGMEVRKMADGTKTYKRFDVRQHVFRMDKAMYLWPIPYKEVTKSNDMIQNPYYN